MPNYIVLDADEEKALKREFGRNIVGYVVSCEDQSTIELLKDLLQRRLAQLREIE